MSLKPFQMKPVFLFAIFFFSLRSLTVPGFAKSSTGNIMGFVYGEDGKTPVQDAIVLLRGLDTDKVYQSEPTGKFGTYRLSDIESGTYVMGLKIKEKSYNVNDYVKVAKGKTRIFSLLLISPGQQVEITHKITKKEKKKKKKFLFNTPEGTAILIGGTAIALNLFDLPFEPEASPTER